MTKIAFRLSERRGYRALPRRTAVYQIRNTKTGERYIGCSTDVYARARAHCSRLRNDSPPHHPALKKAVRERGFEVFVFEVLEFFEGDSAERECREYTAINAVPKSQLYNRLIAPYRTRI